MPNYRNSIQGTIAANDTAVTLAYRQFTNGGVGIQITGSFTGTLQFEVTIDGTNFMPVRTLNITDGSEGPTTTSNGIYRFDVVGILVARVRATAWSSGTATVTIAGMPG